MRRIVSVAIASFILFTTNTYCQELTDRELGIYYEYFEITYTPGEGTPEEEQNRAKQEVAKEYGVTVDEVDDIHHRKWTSEPTEQDWQIYNERSEKLDILQSLPEKASNEEYFEMDKEIASKYGIPVFVPSETWLRVFYYKYIVQPGQQSN